MSVEIKIPKLGVAMEKGILEEWLVADGATVESGDPLYTLSTDKAESEIESPADGTIRLHGEEGEEYDVGHLIAEID